MPISSRKLQSYKRAEKVARELRYQFSDARHSTQMNHDILFKLLSDWMKITGDIKYERP